ncbi:MAG: hypothetical protein GY705_11965 [Bacteroidetes bacterium]|nr:hypothetical protein [Bacteroidota bacterium]
MRILLYLSLMFLLFSSQKCDRDQKYSYDSGSIIKMSKTNCFGWCPVYSIEINGEGEALYKGERHVKREGKYEMQLPAAVADSLFNLFVDADYFSFKDEYSAQVTDLPTTYLTFKHKGQEKKIRMYYNVPEKLRELSKYVEKIAFSEGWNKL